MTSAGSGPAPISIAAEIDRLCETGATGESGLWFHRRISRADRASVLHSVFFDSDPRWLPTFTVMLVLSGGIATLGLSQDSAATVIGSMIIAPLGAAMVGLGGAVAAAWPREAARMVAVVVGGAVMVVATGVVLGLLLPAATPTGQILARTNPDLRDLGVALLAGAAGAYAYTRPSLSSTLVGVAIAVALVPPLATIGLMLEERRWTLAKGAFTLFAANFVGITLAAVAVLLISGFVPLPQLRSRSLGVVTGVAATLAAVALVAIPLSLAYANVMSGAGQHTDVYRQVAATVGAGNTMVDVGKIDINGDAVTIDLSDPANAPAASEFEADLVDEIGPAVTVTIK